MPPAFGFGFRIERQRLLGISYGVIHVGTGRETAGEIRKPYTDRLIRAGILNDGGVMGHVHPNLSQASSRLVRAVS